MGHKVSMQHSLHLDDDDEKRVEFEPNAYRSNVSNLKRNIENNPDDDVLEGIDEITVATSASGTVLGKTRSGSTLLRELTSSNLDMLELQNTVNTQVTDPGDDLDQQYTHSVPSSVDPDPGDEMETPIGGQIVMGQAQGTVAFMKR